MVWSTALLTPVSMEVGAGGARGGDRRWGACGAARAAEKQWDGRRRSYQVRRFWESDYLAYVTGHTHTPPVRERG